MSYQLLTGATGLLGNYLLRDGLRAGRQMAVIVRPSNMESPTQRIESVLVRWERELGHALPRPPVLEGNICEPDLGLTPETVDWVGRHCTSMIHNAASLSFVANERTGEPYRSNIEGTRNVLELCRKTGIRKFHQVSSSYVCGLRTGRVLESELDVGQQMGNDYEKTKIKAEQMVRAADFIDAPTIYRPAIIIGDAVTGYTTTFHGFYTPLKIGQALVDQFKPGKIDGEPLLAALGLSGHEHKNFVPVDWVSRLITYFHGRPELHGQTYHLAPTRRAPVATCREVIEKALGEYVEQSKDHSSVTPEMAQMEETFVDQMGAYRAYWRDDPEFDLTNTQRAAPHLVACDVGHETLLRTSRYALATNFGWPRPQPERPDFDVANHLGRIVPTGFSTNGAGKMKVGLQVNGPGGGQWTLTVDGSRPVAAEVGLSEGERSLLYLNSRTFKQCVQGPLAPEAALRLGLVTIEADEMAPGSLLGVLAAVTSRTTANDVDALVAAQNQA